MTPYQRWAESHALKFGLRDNGDLATLLSWECEFRGASTVLLAEATAWLASHPEEFANCDVRFFGKMTGHLRLIKAFIAKRMQQSAPEEAKLSQLSTREREANAAEWFRLRNQMAGRLAMPAERK